MKVNPISTWPEVEKVYTDFRSSSKRWIFRGQRDFKMPLKTTLERALVDRFGIKLDDAQDTEDRLLREFKRHLHRYTNDVPDNGDKIRWLALMQHHGAPTRLLDFTYSFYIAVFFAIEKAKPGDTCAVWAIDLDWIWKTAKAELPPELIKNVCDPNISKDPDTINGLFNIRKKIIVTLTPMQLDDRLAVQQGTFACGLDITKSFDNLIHDLAKTDREYKEHVCKVKLNCSREFIKDAIIELNRMNIKRLSLFPGVDGLAQGMENAIVLPIQSLYG